MVFYMGPPMFRSFVLSLAVLLVAFSAAGDANAARRMQFVLDTLQTVAMQTEDVALAPLSFVRFCMDHGRECVGSGQRDDRIALSEDTAALIDLVNRDVNGRIRPIAKADIGGLNRWSVNPSAGDCNDYAVSKRHELIKRGLPASALLLAVARTSWGEGHLLLIARTDRGDIVLDNLVPTIRPWDQTDYAWLKLQSPADPMRWEAVSADARAVRIAAALQRSKALAAARAESRREARLQLAQARQAAENQPSPQRAIEQEPAVALSLVLPDLDVLLARAVSAPVQSGPRTDESVVALPRFVFAQMAQKQAIDLFGATAQLSMDLSTGGEWTTAKRTFTVALADGAETTLRHSVH